MRVGGSFDAKVQFVNFNQDNSCVFVGTNDGFDIFTTEPFKKCYGNKNGKAVIVEMLYCTSLLAIVQHEEGRIACDRTVRLWNSKTDSILYDCEVPEPVLNVKLNRKRMVVVTETRVHIFDLATMKKLHEFETSPNPTGIIALSSDDAKSFLAAPGLHVGDVVIYDLLSTNLVNTIQAHRGAVTNLTFNNNGSLLATVSETGTIIRIFSIPSATKIHSFRRGTYSANVYHMSFSEDSNILVVSSDTGTVHVYRLDQLSTYQKSKDWASSLLPTQVVSASSYLASYIPGSVTDYLDNARDYASVRLPTPIVPTLCCLKGNSHIFLANASGVFTDYQFNPSVGGECKLDRQFSMIERDSEEVATRYLT
eukprot:TRINITY_DN3235_c0_g1_i1.p1 TRINITY_DN3235_c0_g1~~TRINITY_DN3235_c0_g1_i1.p1  ORF type:complete len:366 (-),score=63.98 TRINITY_DN3235_c0_g1_i1:217-1314(-)